MIYGFGEYELDTAAYELRHLGVGRPVEPLVFELLHLLIANRHRMVGKDELVAHLWRGRAVSDMALSTQIKTARKAIGDDGKEQRLVRTVHGKGFRFVGAVTVKEHAKAAAPDNSERKQQEIRFCTAADGTRIAFAEVGDGPPLVKTANWMSHLDFEWDSPVWRHWIAGLSARHRLVRYDERGNGMSDRDVADLSFEAMVSDLETVVDAIGLKRFPLFGISQGCAVAVEYAMRHPERVSGLILYGGFVQGWRKSGEPLHVGQREALTILMRTGWGQDNPAFRQVFTSRFVPGASQEQMDWFNELQRMTVTPEAAARFHEVFGTIDVSHRLAAVRHPTLVLHAVRDAEITFGNGRAFATGIRNARFVPLESDNHILLADEPAFRRLLQEIDRFLDGLPASDAADGDD